jgi:hypothetical protein
MRVAGALLAALLLALALPGGALAHGDGPTHFLELEDVYPGYASPPTAMVERQLRGYVLAAARAGMPVKVAVATEGDVTDRPRELRRPQAYAESVVSITGIKVPVIIVTPYGVGIVGAKAPHIAVPLNATADLMAKTAMEAVRAVAKSGGHPLPAKVALAPPPPASAVGVVATPVPGGSSSRGWLPFGVFFAVFGVAALFFEVRSRLGRRRRLDPHSTNLTVTEGS